MKTYQFGDRFADTLPKIKDHAAQRATERYGVPEKQAKQWINNHLIASKFVGDVTDGYGKHSYIFAHKGVAIAISDDFTHVNTIIDPKTNSNKVSQPIFDKFAKTATAELRKAKRIAAQVKRRNDVEIAALTVEVAELKLRLLRARSEAKINAYNARAAAVNLRIEELQRETNEAIRNHTVATMSVAAYV